MGKLLFGNDAALQYAWVSLRARVAKVRSGELERGASAVEWVVISMIVVTIVAVVGFAISTALRNKATTVSTCIQNANGTNNGC
jgi:Flp pilus assembly pilin Flp